MRRDSLHFTSLGAFKCLPTHHPKILFGDANMEHILSGWYRIACAMLCKNFLVVRRLLSEIPMELERGGAEIWRSVV